MFAEEKMDSKKEHVLAINILLYKINGNKEAMSIKPAWLGGKVLVNSLKLEQCKGTMAIHHIATKEKEVNILSKKTHSKKFSPKFNVIWTCEWVLTVQVSRSKGIF